MPTHNIENQHMQRTNATIESDLHYLEKASSEATEESLRNMAIFGQSVNSVSQGYL